MHSIHSRIDSRSLASCRFSPFGESPLRRERFALDASTSTEALREQGRVHPDEPRGAAGDDPEEAGEHELPHQRPPDEAAATSERQGNQGRVKRSGKVSTEIQTVTGLVIDNVLTLISAVYG